MAEASALFAKSVSGSDAIRLLPANGKSPGHYGRWNVGKQWAPCSGSAYPRSAKFLPRPCQGPVGIKPTAKKNSRPPGGRAYSERLPPGGRLPFPAGCFIHPDSRHSSRYSLGTPPVLTYRSLFVTCSRCGLPLPNLWATSSKVTLYLPGGRSPSLLKVGKKATLKQTLRLCGAVCRRHSRGRWGGLFRGCTGPSG